MEKNNCFYKSEILLPRAHFENWAVIACDQYTSEPEYWQDAEKSAAGRPSALKLILPEVYLKEDNTDAVKKINHTMKEYIDGDLFDILSDALIFVERTQSDGVVRRGIVGKVDLECYDYHSSTDAEIRATEQTVLERIPPRVEIRKNAPLELPHVMLLFDDVKDSVMSFVEERKGGFKKLYDFELMCGGGHINGYLIDDATSDGILSLLDGIKKENDGLLFCVGDGNHSLATAKECHNINQTDMSQYALVEIVNIHEEALKFEPIYRIMFGVEPEKLIELFVEYCGGDYDGADAQTYICVYGENKRKISVRPMQKLAVGTLQVFLDKYLRENPTARIDYIHGEDSLKKLAKGQGSVGFLFDGMQKNELFPAVIKDGSLPRKTFSMGHADDKRFYVEARRIK